MRDGRRFLRELILLCSFVAAASAQGQDWLIDAEPYKARIEETPDGRGIVLDNGLIRRTLRRVPDAATIGFDDLMSSRALLRAVEPEAVVTIDGARHCVGGLRGQVDHAYLDPTSLDSMTADDSAFHLLGHEIGPIEERLAWKRVRHCAPDVRWPPAGLHLKMIYAAPPTAVALQQLRVEVHYEIYDGIPLLGKWIAIENRSGKEIVVDAFECERLAVVESASYVGGPAGDFPASDLHVETDYAFGGSMSCADSNRPAVRWVADPQFETQVHYLRQTPCLLEVGPEVGPAARVAPGGRLESPHAFELVFDSTDRERRGLAVRRMYRTLAPWVTENPLMMHVRFADRATVENAIDQCASVGFEMVILTFGSGFDAEDESAANVARMRVLAEYAAGKGIEIGGYSLLGSRSVGGGDDVVMPQGRAPVFGSSPCLCSEWGLDYFRRMRGFFEQTGFALLEHDGSYPGDVCAAENHPGHRGLPDSQWLQWREIADFYAWCRRRGIYLNVPDWYFLCGSNKCGMGYRESNWSLPRDRQVLHTLQNIHDGTWEKTPSMGWMFVPLTEYQGGGEAATIEPLREHLDHYQRMLVANLAHGVQACYRGPRLFDGDETRAMLQKWVGWFKSHRDILESDLIHGRRADGHGLHWMLHVNPRLDPCGMLIVFNPRDEPVKETLDVDLYYTGLTDLAWVEGGGSPRRRLDLDRRLRVRLEVEVPARGFSWYAFGRS